ncbi:Uncharacterized protein conserved in archaea [Archaeoglobus sulfaticallidus PM70-1]|uniref:Uncharacterized protein conserved in archaea n=1 Tax=Archaeoglobus sulfaticallidus PM70-1 TaxID=387631 RepID=N0BBT1_9EURY|nr:hypothetical protein [Archaeoglobus sulfaticallidus]AGK61054.1 Uncharacterized protein conserved in archaea [Archaeoglobus sulfaticallidus PM70-1]
MGKILVIISSGKEAKEKAMTGVMFATNSMKFGWADSVEIIFIGPSQDLLVEDEEFRNFVISNIGEYKPLVCKFLADSRQHPKDKLEFARVEYVGSIINQLIDEGYTPLVF